jgi:hypothetical protein
MWDGGNQWSGWCGYLSFFKHIAKLELKIYEKWQHYETAAVHGGPRISTPEFCMISDRPKYIKMDELNRPHCETGPYCEWRDGWKLWYWHGFKVTEQIIMRPETLTVEQVEKEANTEVRRVLIERMGVEKYLTQSGATLVDSDEKTSAPRVLFKDKRNNQYMFCTDGGTGKFFALSVPDNVKTCAEAHTAICGFDESKILGES